MLAAHTLVPLVASLILGESTFSGRSALVVVVLLAAAPLSRLPAPAHVQVHEALTVTALVFVLGSLLMAYPMMGAGLSFLDALSESVSPVTTTGR